LDNDVNAGAGTRDLGAGRLTRTITEHSTGPRRRRVAHVDGFRYGFGAPSVFGCTAITFPGPRRLALPKARACRMVALVLLTADEHDREQAILLTPTRSTNQGKVGEGITRCALF